jgi:hypothetical protein
MFMQAACSTLPVLFVASLALLVPGHIRAQEPSSQQQPSSESSRPVTIADGGVRQTLESIFIPPIVDAPFSLTLDTEWTRPLGTGGTFTVVNTRHIMRDTSGRIYEERWYLVPKNGKAKSSMNYIQIADPNKHTLYNCEIAEKKCYLLTYNGSTTAVYKPPIGASGSLDNGAGYRNHEDLGHNTIAGVDTVGYRDTITINPGVAGNDSPMITLREFWFSPPLGINLLSRYESPAVGKELFTVREINTAPPEPQYFSLPEGFDVVDRRQAQPTQ